MKILFVYPRFRKYLADLPESTREALKPIIGQFTTPPSLGIPILAALTPERHQIEVVDDNRGDPLDFDTDADLVAINSFTPQASRALELGDRFREAGKTVVIGGIFPSMVPDEAAAHADSVNIGEGEPTWATILQDAEKGELKPRYRGGNRFDLADLPIPRREALYTKAGYDWHASLVQVSRGCGFGCAMCVIPEHFGSRLRMRPVDKIVEEIEEQPYDQIYLADDSIFLKGRRVEAWARELLEALVPLNRRLFVSSTLALNTDPDFLELLAKAGTKTFYCTLNVDPVSMRALRGGEPEAEQKVIDLARRIRDLGMEFFASYGIGRDWDDEGVADRILELSRRADVRTAEFFIFCPFPGTPQFRRMKTQDRLLHTNWELYNGANVVYRPQQMSADRLAELYLYLWQELYRGQIEDAILKNLGKNTSESPHPDAGRPAGE